MPDRRVLSALAVTGTAVLTAGVFAAPAEAAPTSIRILTVNDFHGRLVAEGDNPGAAVLAGAVAQLSTGQPTAFVSAGDNIGASPFVSAVQEDAPTIEILNEMDLVTSAVGNHEFDRGYDFLADPLTHGLDGLGLAEWSTLGANVDGEDPEMAPSDVVEVGGVSVGFVGVVTRETASLVSPDGIAGISFVDPVAPANAAADALRDGDTANGEADVVVLLAHEGAPTTAAAEDTCAGLLGGTSAFSEIVRGANANIAAIVGGHTHLTVDCDLPHPDGGAVPRPVIEANSYGMSLGQLDLTVDPDTQQVSAAQGGVVDVMTGGFTADADIQAMVDAAVAEAEIVGAVPIGQITTDITRAVDADGEEDRGAESALGNLIADVQLAATSGPGLGDAQIAFMNPGGIREDFVFAASGEEGDGVVTYAEAATVQPFANGVVTVSLTGAQVKEVLEEQWQPDGSSRPFLALGVSEGLSYTFDEAAARGSRVTSITLDSAPLDPAATYRVTVNSFLAAGGDNFTTLAEGTDRQDNGFNDLNVLVDYFEANSPVSPDPAPRRTAASDETAGGSTGGGSTGGTTGGGQNRGLSVDTGLTTSTGTGVGVLGLLGVVVLLGAAVAARPVWRARR